MALKRAIADSIYSAAEILVVAVDLADSANYAQAEVGRGGEFTLKGLRPAVYRLEAFRDLNGDKAASVDEEPVAFVDSVEVKPGRTADVGVLSLRRRSEVLESR